jgi:hypothetical protein
LKLEIFFSCSSLRTKVFFAEELRMLRKTNQLNYYLAYNARAKARPNIGLRGCGFWTSEVYNKQGTWNWIVLMVGVPFVSLYIIMYRGFFAELDEIGGGGPKPLDYGFRRKDKKPWDFAFDIGEGFAAGPARYRPAPGACSEAELHGSVRGGGHGHAHH